MPNPWFRLYSEFADDPKVQMLSEAMQRRLVMLMCSKCKGETLREQQMAFHWRISAADLTETKALFIESGFIDSEWHLLNWDRRQFLSDSSTPRVRKHREKVRTETLPKQERNVTETGPSVSVSVSVSEEESEEKIDASMAVSGLIDMIQLHTFDVRVVLDRLAQKAEKDGEDMRQWAEGMSRVWLLYEESRPKLEKPWGPEKFFGHGHYRTPANWPWKDGCAPPKLIPQSQPAFERPERMGGSIEEIREKLKAGHIQ